MGGPCSRFYIYRLRSGRLLLINHYEFTGRNNLTAFLPEDDGKTFPYKLLLDKRKSVSYPDAMEQEDGTIDIVYDRESGCFLSSMDAVYKQAREILTARITERDIISGELVTPGSYLKNVVCKLDQYDPSFPDPFAKQVK